MSNRKVYFGLVVLVVLVYLCTSIFYIRTSKNIIDTDGERAIADHLHLSLDDTLRLDSSHNAHQMETWFGWYPPEPWGTWANGERSFLYVNVDKMTGTHACLLITGQSVLSKKHARDRIKVFVNGTYAGRFVQTLEHPTASGTVQIPASALPANSNGDLAVELLSPDATSLAAISKSPDTRVLGFGITSIELVHCRP